MLNFIKLFIDTTDKLNLCNHFRQQQIEIAKNHCFNNNIQIRKIYKNNNYIKLLENVDRKFFIKKYFPIKQNVNYNNIKLSLESMYSVSHWRDNDEIIKYLNKINFNIKDSILIDPTANVGGISIYFAFHFKNVYSIEIDNLNFSYLNHNIKLYNLNNITTYLNDSNKLLPKLVKKLSNEKTVVFFDPPWGGFGYSQNEQIDLFLGNINLYTLVDYIIDDVSIVLIKAPFNYNIDNFKQIVKKKIDIIKLKKYQIIVVFS